MLKKQATIMQDIIEGNDTEKCMKINKLIIKELLGSGQTSKILPDLATANVHTEGSPLYG